MKRTRSSGTQLLDPYSGRMECRVCGAEHFARIARGGHYYRGSWQCQNGCKPENLRRSRAARDGAAP